MTLHTRPMVRDKRLIGMNLNPQPVKISRGVYGEKAWFYEDRGGLDILTEHVCNCGNCGCGSKRTIELRITWNQVASYARRRLGRKNL